MRLGCFGYFALFKNESSLDGGNWKTNTTQANFDTHYRWWLCDCRDVFATSGKSVKG